MLLDDPLQLADPKAAFTSNPYAEAEVRLTYTRVSDMFGGEPDEPHEKPGEEFAKGHYEQLIAGHGHDPGRRRGRWAIDGFGLRDHSWGPRYWQAPWYYRWLTANFGDDFGFMASRIAKRDGEGTRGGFVWEDGQLHLCDHAEVSHRVDRAGHATTPVVRATLRSSRVRQREWSIHRRGAHDGAAAQPPPDPPTASGCRPASARASPSGRSTASTGSGWGLSEYLDQIIDDQPVGLAE